MPTLLIEPPRRGSAAGGFPDRGDCRAKNAKFGLVWRRYHIVWLAVGVNQIR